MNETDHEVLTLLTERVGVILGLGSQPVDEQSRFDEDLHADSLDIAEAVESVRQALRDRGYAVTEDDDRLLGAETVGEAARLISAELSDGG